MVINARRREVESRAEVLNDLVVTKEEAGCKSHEGDVALRAHIHASLDDHHKLSTVLPIGDDLLPSREVLAVHLYNQLIPKAFLTVVEHMLRSLNELREELLNQVVLHLGTQLVIEVKVTDKHVMVLKEALHVGILNPDSDLTGQEVGLHQLLDAVESPLVSVVHNVVDLVSEAKSNEERTEACHDRDQVSCIESRADLEQADEDHLDI